MPAQSSLAAASTPRDRHLSLAWLVPMTLLAGAAALLAAQLPPELALPGIAVLLVTAGLALAAGLYLLGRRGNHARSAGWDVAGAIVFLGFAAALLGDGEQALAALDHLQANGLAALSR